MALILDETFANGIPTKVSDIDPYASYVSSYIPFSGNSGSTTFTDTTGKTWTASNATLSTSQINYTSASGSFTGATNSYISTPYSSDFDFGTGDFTVEAWVYLTADSPAGGDGNKIANIFGLNTATPSTTYWQFLLTGDSSSTGTGLSFYISDAGTTVGRSKTVTITKNVWHHIAVSKNSLGVYLCLDGVLYPTAPIAVNVNNGSNGLTIGVGSLTSTYERPFTGYISEAKITKGFARYTPNNSAYTYTVNGDFDYNYVGLLMNFEGANNSTTFTDNSKSPKTFFAGQGSPVISTTQYRIGSSSLYLDGSSSVQGPASSDYDFGSSDFTVEFWFRLNSIATDQQLIYYGNSTVSTGSDVAFGVMFAASTANISGWYYNGTTQTGSMSSANSSIVANTWYHVVYQKANLNGANAQTTQLYLNGTYIGAATGTSSMNTPASRVLRIGKYSDGTSRLLNGYIDGLRITTGKGRYPFANMVTLGIPYPTTTSDIFTSSYTSTESTNQVGSIVTNDNGTVQLLLHGEGTNGGTTFTDSSTNNWTPVSVASGITTTTSTYNFGSSSINFTGNTDQRIAYTDSWTGTFLSGDYTIEGSLRRTNSGLVGYFLSVNNSTYQNGVSTMPLSLQVGANGFGNSDRWDKFVFSYREGGSYIASTTTIVNNTWYTFAVTKSGNTFRLFLNGNLEASVTDSGYSYTAPPSPVLNIGTNPSSIGGYSMTGQLDEIRITTGVALYTASYTAQSAAFPNPSPVFNLVSSHLSFNDTNNSTTFTDQAGNTWSSIGTPQIKTAESKFGGSSGYFSVGNYLSLTNTSKFDLGTTPFTVECWFKPSDLSAVVSTLMPLITAGRIDVNATGGGWSLYATVLPGSYDAKFALARYGTDGTTIKVESEYIAVLNTSTWYHICATRDESGFTDLYLNGKRIARSGELSGIALSVPNSLTITIGTSGTVASASLYPYVGYIDELRIVKGIETYKDEFTVPTAAYAYTTETQYKYTKPNTYLGYISSPTWATASSSSTAPTITYNSTFKAVDYSAANVTTVWEIHSIPTAMYTGEIEFDFEVTADSGTTRQVGPVLVNPTNGTNGVGNYIRNNGVLTQINYYTAAWTINTTTSLFTADDKTLSCYTLNKRHVYNIRWDTTANNSIRSNLEVRIDGNLVYSGPYSFLTRARIGFGVINATARIHAIRVWDRPTQALRSMSTNNFASTDIATRMPIQTPNSLVASNPTDAGVTTQNRLVQPNIAPNPNIAPADVNKKIVISYYTTDNYMKLDTVMGYRDGPQGVYGTGYISGTVKRSASPSNTPVVTQLQLVEESSQTVIAKQNSDSSGNYKFEGLQTSLRYTVYAWDPIKAARAVILDNVFPKIQTMLSQNISFSLSGVSSICYLTSIFDSQYDSLLTSTNVVGVFHGNLPYDYSPYRRTMTSKGGVRLSEIISTSNISGTRGKGSALQLSLSTNGVLYTPYNSNMDFGNGDWYVEFNVMVPVMPTSAVHPFAYGYDGSTNGGIYVNMTTNGTYVIAYTHTTSTFASYSSSAGAYTTNTWYNVCITRVGNYVYGYWNRNLVLITAAGNISTGLASRGYSIGGNTAGGSIATSIVYVDDLIMVKGIGRPGASSYAISYTPYPENTFTDTYQANVLLMLHGDGTNGSTSFTDNSFYNKTATNITTTTISNSQSKFGGTSIYFAGGNSTSSGFEYSDSTDWQFGIDDFTIEFWLYGNTNIAATAIFTYGHTTASSGGSAGYGFRAALRFNCIDFYISRASDSTGAIYSSSAVLVANSWNHIAISRVTSTGAVYIHINGANAYNTTGSAYANTTVLVPSGTRSLKFGRHDNIGGLPVLTGCYIDDFRITRGVARYATTSSITVPSAAYPDAPALTTLNDTYWLNTSFLCHFEGADGSTTLVDTRNNATMTLNGTTRLVTSDYAIGSSSLYFDGTDVNNGVTITNNNSLTALGTSDFTIEFWIKPFVSYGNFNKNILCTSPTIAIATTSELSIYLGNGTLTAYFGGAGITTTSVIPINTWTHVILQRTSSYVTFWLNGKIDVYTTTSNMLTANITSPITSIGGARTAVFGANTYFTGYIDELRITKAARYNSAMITLNGHATTRKFDILSDPLYGYNEIFYHGDSLVDVTGKNRVTYNYGGANVDNTTFAITGYSTLKLPVGGYIGVDASSSPIVIGTGDFTVEFYANWAFGNTSGTKGIISFVQNNTLTSNLFKLSGIIENGGVTYYLNGNNCTNIIASSIGPKMWHHVAIVRSSGTTTFYINGTPVASSADVTNYATTSYVSIGSGSYTNYGSDTISGNIAELRISKLARYTTAFIPDIYRLVDTYTSSISISGVSSTSQIGQVTQDPYYDNVVFRVTFDEDGFYPRDSSKYQLGNGIFDTSTYSAIPYKTATGAVYGNALKMPLASSANNDYIWTAPAGMAFGTGAFTVEAWGRVNTTTYNASEVLIQFNGMSPNTMQIWFGMYFGRLIDSNSYFSVGNYTMGAGSWYHIALTRDDSGTVRAFVNGALNRTTLNDTKNWTQPTSIQIGPTQNEMMIDDVRVTKGIARYTAAFTPSRIML